MIGLVDPNNNANNSRYQSYGRSWATVMGKYVLDPWILKLSGVPQELWRIQYYASDLLVLRLVSGVTLEKFNSVKNSTVTTILSQFKSAWVQGTCHVFMGNNDMVHLFSRTLGER